MLAFEYLFLVVFFHDPYIVMYIGHFIIFEVGPRTR
jgi:hypothetical protein